MKHLSRDEMLRAVEEAAAARAGVGGRSDTGRSSRLHLEACPACREAVQALAAVRHDAGLVDMPEPSPLFWDHFSRRVAEAVRAEASTGGGMRRDALWWPPPWWRSWRTWRVLAPTLAAAAGLVLVVGTPRHAPVSTPGAEPVRTVPSPVVNVPAPEVRPDDDSWNVFSTLAWELDPTGTGIAPATPGSADSAVLELSDEEQGQLIRLLRAEIGRYQSRVEG